MDRFRDQILAGAAFALDQDGGGFTGRHFLHEVHQLRHLRRDARQLRDIQCAAHFSAQRLHFGPQAGRFQRVLDGDLEFVEVERLADEIVSPQLESGFDVIELRIGRDHDHRRAHPAIFLSLFQDLNPVHVRQAHVEQNEVGRFRCASLQPRLSRSSFDDVVSPFFALLAQRPAHQALVIHNQNLVCWHSRFSLLRKEKKMDRTLPDGLAPQFFPSLNLAISGLRVRSKVVDLVILRAGEAGARDRRSVEAVAGVDGNVSRRIRPSWFLLTALRAQAVARSLGGLASSSE